MRVGLQEYIYIHAGAAHSLPPPSVLSGRSEASTAQLVTNTNNQQNQQHNTSEQCSPKYGHRGYGLGSCYGPGGGGDDIIEDSTWTAYFSQYENVSNSRHSVLGCVRKSDT